MRVEQAYEFDGVLIEEQPGTVPYVRTRAREADVVRAEEAVRRAKELAATVVVAVHWGVPWCYLPSNQGPLAGYQQPLGRRLVDAGADLVIGHHPHCLHPVELTADGEPVIPSASTARRILRQVEELSQELAPTTRVDGDGRVRF
ncbi:CapA family protein [Streptomyces sp. DASNCL29]|uniref:CapA family protein n=1 Tax=Streptomyces sp. DASNCL29 TaxID=2583819 RepID=UPI001485CC94|nr:CapA family protein [Streptomyces sp. DASNCL29]